MEDEREGGANQSEGPESQGRGELGARLDGLVPGDRPRHGNRKPVADRRSPASAARRPGRSYPPER